MTTFAHDLDALIERHLGSPSLGDDFADIIEALYARAERLAERAYRYRFSDETEAEFRERVAALP
jgi:hypothetical protein